MKPSSNCQSLSASEAKSPEEEVLPPLLIRLRSLFHRCNVANIISVNQQQCVVDQSCSPKAHGQRQQNQALEVRLWLQGPSIDHSDIVKQRAGRAADLIGNELLKLC